MSRTRVLLIAAAVALFVGVAATVAGGILVQSGSVTDCSPNPCVRYKAYGWPLKWRTNTPWHGIQTTGMDRGIFGYNREGFSFGMFATVTLFFAAPVVAVEVAGLGAWWAWRSFRLRRGRLPPSV